MKPFASDHDQWSQPCDRPIQLKSIDSMQSIESDFSHCVIIVGRDDIWKSSRV